MFSLPFLSPSTSICRSCRVAQWYSTCFPCMGSWLTTSNATPHPPPKKNPTKTKGRDEINGKVIFIHTDLAHSSSDGLPFRISWENFNSYTWAYSQLLFSPLPLGSRYQALSLCSAVCLCPGFVSSPPPLQQGPCLWLTWEKRKKEVFECGLTAPANIRTISAEYHSGRGKPVPQQDKGVQGQNNGEAEGSMLGHQCLPWRWSLKALPRALHQLPGTRAYQVKVLRWCLLAVPGEVTLGFCGEVNLGSGPSFIAFLGVWPARSLSPPKSDRVGFGTADFSFQNLLSHCRQ